ncbi:MAG: hypothetical protein R6W82_10775 [bacterium]
MRARSPFPALLAAAASLLILQQALPAGAQEGERDPIIGSYEWRQIGPANMSGRVSDLEGVPGTGTFYVAAAAGGLWKTVNAGTTFELVFEGGATAAVGEIALAPSDPDRVYVGMGEPHNRNSVSWGDGVYRSDDGGETWEHMGLEDIGSVGRIAVHPDDPDIVYVAAQGLQWDLDYGRRGLFKSTNGGEDWTLVKGFDDGTGFYDVQIDPSDPDVVYATSWWRIRKPWVFTSGGGDHNAGIWKSTDAGTTWRRLEGGGLPPIEGWGKSSIVIFPGDTDILYARIESFTDDPDAPRPEEEEGQQRRRGGGVPNLGGTYRSTDAGATWEMVDWRNGRPFYYCQLRVDPVDPDRVYLVDGSLYRIDDVDAQREVVDDYEDRRENDTVENITGNHHVDFHALWIDPTFPDHIITGSDGGVGVSWDAGETWDSLKNLPIGQFYALGYDMQVPYHVYGGLQDNGTWGGPHLVTDPGGIQNEHWSFYNGGDGFHAQVDPVDPDIVLYAESQRGRVNRHNLATGESSSITPRPPREEDPNLSEEQREFLRRRGGSRSNILNAEPGELADLRFNWSTPFILSPHNPRTLYLGAQYLFKSTDRGESWTVISGDLTYDDPVKYEARNRGDMQTGAENHCSIITIGESPMLPGLVWVGTDDGRIHYTRDGGNSWTEVTLNFTGVPDSTWVSRVRPSAHEPGRAYVTFDGHRTGDLATYVFRTDDFGANWTEITGGLPAEDPAYVITEDPVNPDLLYLGTESGVYVSRDRGDRWQRFNNNLPVAPVHDLAVHPRENDLIIATHGLAFWVMDDITGLQALDAEAMEEPFQLFPTDPVYAWSSSGQTWFPGDKYYAAENPPFAVRVEYWVGEEVDEVTLEITDIEGDVLREETAPGTRGLHFVDISLRPDYRGGSGGGRQANRGRPIEPGRHMLKVTVGDEEITRVIRVLPMPGPSGG